MPLSVCRELQGPLQRDRVLHLLGCCIARISPACCRGVDLIEWAAWFIHVGRPVPLPCCLAAAAAPGSMGPLSLPLSPLAPFTTTVITARLQTAAGVTAGR